MVDVKFPTKCWAQFLVFYLEQCKMHLEDGKVTYKGTSESKAGYSEPGSKAGNSEPGSESAVKQLF